MGFVFRKNSLIDTYKFPIWKVNVGHQ